MWAVCWLSRLVCGFSFSRQCNSMASFRQNSTTIPHQVTCCLGSTGRISATHPGVRGFESKLGQVFFRCLCPLRHVRSMRSCPMSVSAVKTTPKPPSLLNSGPWYVMVTGCDNQHIHLTRTVSGKPDCLVLPKNWSFYGKPAKTVLCLV